MGPGVSGEHVQDIAKKPVYNVVATAGHGPVYMTRPQILGTGELIRKAMAVTGKQETLTTVGAPGKQWPLTRAVQPVYRAKVTAVTVRSTITVPAVVYR